MDDGAELRAGAALSVLCELSSLLSMLPTDRAGVRIGDMLALRPYLASSGAIGAIAADVLGAQARAVRAILFDKNAQTNWALGWHQDRTICVRRRIEVEGFGPWTVKAGMQHVAPPFALLEHMVTLRVHLDDVDADNAPLLIAPGSHRAGLVPEANITDVVARGTHACLAMAGDVWVYATPMLHASDAACRLDRRRVLQVDFSADMLPDGLEWQGV